MPGTTTRLSLQYPLSSESPAGNSQMQTLAQELDALVSGFYSDVIANRPVAGVRGREFWASDTGILSRDDGAAWHNVGPINTAGGTIVSSNPGDTVVAGSSGLTADAAHRHAREAWGGSGDIAASAVGDTVLAGSSGKVADAAHRHARESFSVTTPGQVAGTGAVGTSASPARADHVHAGVTSINDSGAGATQGAVSIASVPTGAMLEHAGFSAPAGFFLTDGSAKSRSTYAALFAAITIALTGDTHSSNSITNCTNLTNAVIGMPISGPGIPSNTTITNIVGTTLTISNPATATATGVALVIAPYGVGDGSTTFNLPDKRGRVGVAAGAGSGLTVRANGQTGGVETYALQVAELAQHHHSGPSHQHGTTTLGTSDPGGHEHNISFGGGLGGIGGQNGGDWNPAVYGVGDNNNTTSDGAHTHSITGSVDAGGTGNTGDTGIGTAHQNMQPFLVVTHIIKS